MKKKSICGLLLTGILLLGGCGNAGATYRESPAMATDAATNGAYYGDMEESAMEDYGMGMGGAEAPMAPEVGESGETAAQNNRKLIRNVNLSVETKTFDELMNLLDQRVKGAGGYVENGYSYNGSNFQGGESVRNATLTIRIPADKLDGFLSELATVANIVTKNENVSDVTLTYVDLESHRKVLRAEETSLLEMMEKVETIEDMIALESRLSDVRYQLESMESQLRTYDNLVDYATLTISITEVKELTPVAEQTATERMGSGFVSSLKSLGRGLQNFGVGFVINLPYLVFWGVIILVIFLIVRGIIRSGEKKRRKKYEALTASASEEKKSESIVKKEETKPEDTAKSEEKKP
ncbi:MAG: DUF4349 domain-containing protein [Lachnospiraceae bacterium]|nr:DUF4349 domain-containing protein [Lachnospiraceae bacterium]